MTAPQPQQQMMLVPSVALGAVLDILQELPYKQVSNLIPVLLASKPFNGAPELTDEQLAALTSQPDPEEK